MFLFISILQVSLFPLNIIINDRGELFMYGVFASLFLFVSCIYVQASDDNNDIVMVYNHVKKSYDERLRPQLCELSLNPEDKPYVFYPINVGMPDNICGVYLPPQIYVEIHQLVKAGSNDKSTLLEILGEWSMKLLNSSSPVENGIFGPSIVSEKYPGLTIYFGVWNQIVS